MSRRAPLDYEINNLLTNNSYSFSRVFKDLPLFVSLCTVLGFGLFMLYSASGQSIGMVSRQLIYIILGLFFMLLVAQLRPESYKNILMNSYWFGLLLLAYVLINPADGYATNRWIDLGFFNFQPSEIIRLLLPLSLVAYLCRRESRPRMSDWFITTIAAFICFYLVSRQPDLGSGLIVFVSGLIPIFLAGLPYRIILGYLVGLAIVAPYVWSNLLLEYQRQRVLTLLNPEADPLGTGWNINQSQTAIGSGGLTGKGYLSGTQSQLDFIPESHSDFIFSVIAEELGLIGILAMFLLYGFIIWRVFRISYQSETNFERITCSSLGFIFLLYILINVLMVIGIIPVVGVPLPLISQGGTSIVVHLLAFGVILSMKKIYR
ncbi:MAG TPA: rod shape-determining protein RodA [SAR86 cluster bacterium]|jgi:rod shape determining protein RodA|nr:rod shape-determining protein RodA [SAR86 cluster bacterium]